MKLGKTDRRETRTESGIISEMPFSGYEPIGDAQESSVPKIDLKQIDDYRNVDDIAFAHDKAIELTHLLQSLMPSFAKLLPDNVDIDLVMHSAKMRIRADFAAFSFITRRLVKAIGLSYGVRGLLTISPSTITSGVGDIGGDFDPVARIEFELISSSPVFLAFDNEALSLNRSVKRELYRDALFAISMEKLGASLFFKELSEFSRIIHLTIPIL